MSEWTHNVCERCWFTTHDLSHHEGGGFRLPVTTVKDACADVCCMCGGTPTISGIYIRRPPGEMLCKGQHEHPEVWSPLVERAEAHEG